MPTGQKEEIKFDFSNLNIPTVQPYTMTPEQKRIIRGAKAKRIWELIYLIPLFIFMSLFLPFYVWFALTMFILPTTYMTGRILTGLVHLVIWLFFFVWWYYAYDNLKYCKVTQHGVSMEPTFHPSIQTHEGQYYMWWPILYKKYIKRFAIIMMYNPFVLDDGCQFLGKRVVAFSGDILFIKNGYIVTLSPDGRQYYMRTPFANVSYGPVKVGGENCMFVLGDNLLQSQDSRAYGALPLSLAAGVYSGINCDLSEDDWNEVVKHSRYYG